MVLRAVDMNSRFRCEVTSIGTIFSDSRYFGTGTKVYGLT